MSTEIKKILACIDFSEYSKETFLYASYLADKTGAELVGLSVINKRDIDAAAMYSRLIGGTVVDVDLFTEKEIERRNDRVADILESIGLADLKRDTIIKLGNPYHEILGAIDELGVDLVVIGTRGLSAHDEKYTILTGSVAERVFKHSPVPVLSVRVEQ